MVALHSG